MKESITVIPATKDVNTHRPLNNDRKKKVAAYVRVSTVKGNQFNSFKNQIDYFQQLIDKHLDWTLVDIYYDEGVTGTNTKGRGGFCRMIDDALDGKIDLILTKSITRFARNTIDAINNIRKLKAIGVEIYFETDNIWTLSEDGELVITLISAMAQEESRSISENTKWGMRKAMQEGKGCVAFSRLLGYERGTAGEYVINEEQASVVRRIYNDFLYGYTIYDIVTMLNEEGIKTVTGKAEWKAITVSSILKNEKYKGDCLMQKYYVENHITHSIKKNNGELPQYYIKGHHEPIITEEQWDMAQMKLKRHKKCSITRSKERFFRTIIYCYACSRKCKSLYGPIVIHRNDPYRGIRYRTRARYSMKCNAPILDERVIILAVFDAIAEIIERSFEGKNKKVNNTELFEIKCGKVRCISIILVYEMLDEIQVLSDSELRLIFSSGREKLVDLQLYKKNSRKQLAYEFIKGSYKEET